MALELIGGGKAGDAPSGQGSDDRLAEAQRLAAEARARLGALADRLADLRRRAGMGDAPSSDRPGGTAPPSPSLGSPSS